VPQSAAECSNARPIARLRAKQGTEHSRTIKKKALLASLLLYSQKPHLSFLTTSSPHYLYLPTYLPTYVNRYLSPYFTYRTYPPIYLVLCKDLSEISQSIGREGGREGGRKAGREGGRLIKSLRLLLLTWGKLLTGPILQFSVGPYTFP
jgi:hypothetical protein